LIVSFFDEYAILSPKTEHAMSQPTQPTYPDEVERYGDAGRRLYDAKVQSQIAIGVPEAEARADALALWTTIVLAAQLTPMPLH
jgi:hypothetical protein